MSYSDLVTRVSSTIGSAVDGVSVFPSNYLAPTNTNEFLRLNVMPTTGSIDNYQGETIQGLIAVSVYVEAGRGQARAFELCDELDDLLQTRQIDSTRFGKSYLNFLGLDRDNTNLYRVDWVIPFVDQF